MKIFKQIICSTEFEDSQQKIYLKAVCPTRVCKKHRNEKKKFQLILQ